MEEVPGSRRELDDDGVLFSGGDVSSLDGDEGVDEYLDGVAGKGLGGVGVCPGALAEGGVGEGFFCGEVQLERGVRVRVIRSVVGGLCV